jgi:hypothetical protein
VAGTVIDKKYMGFFAVKLYGVLSLLALEAELLTASTAGYNECALSSVQASSIQATVSSCVYNMTVESLLGAI